MTDKELLELAAKAAGVEVDASIFFAGGIKSWNPLTDDSDALRLAVKLGISFRRMGHKVIAIGNSQCDEYCDQNAYAATRRVIVRAAADIGSKL